MTFPASILSSMHICPMSTGPIPHVGGPISISSAPTVLINNKPAATIGSQIACIGPPDTVINGSTSVLICGKPAVYIGCKTAHGGTIISGSPNVLIGA